MDKFLSSYDNYTLTSGTVASSSRSPNRTTNESPVSDVVFKTLAPRSPKKDVIDLEYENEGTSGKKKPVRKSEVWDHFTIKKGRNPGDERGGCNYCEKDYACSSRTHGTSSMLVHLRKCKKNPFRVEDKKQKLLSFGASSESGSGMLAIGYSKEACRKALAKMVIMDELPFRSVEGDGFKHFCQVMQPKFIPSSRITVARDVLQLFSEEKA
ncbi:zinc finger BED domain-containing protein DAYSLEEPER-like [Morus notabilis]|uniref:zinc finger BED domain-containing protein DAYSLEEPER-like n=1 Tax=Morus notabilis TaxID=981085 RepID=UPI000CED6136|nr:zinc finger BED domain-containing protein DAYSLEEPER-like [Morus notabilis]